MLVSLLVSGGLKHCPVGPLAHTSSWPHCSFCTFWTLLRGPLPRVPALGTPQPFDLFPGFPAPSVTWHLLNSSHPGFSLPSRNAECWEHKHARFQTQNHSTAGSDVRRQTGLRETRPWALHTCSFLSGKERLILTSDFILRSRYGLMVSRKTQAHL